MLLLYICPSRVETSFAAKIVWNLVVASLQRHEDLGWLGLEVKQGRLRGKVAGLVKLKAG